MPIVASGAGSGLDIANLVSQLVAAEADPTNARLNSRETNLDSELSAFGTLKSALSTFQSSVTKLEDESAFLVYTAASSNEEGFTATANSKAVPGTYNIEVIQLAGAEKLRSVDYTSSADVVGTGTLDISLGLDTFQLTIDATNNTLEDIRAAINSSPDNPGVTASLISVDSGTQLILSSDKLGASNNITIVATDDDVLDGFDLTLLDSSNFTTLRAASDAVIKVDTQTVTRENNTFSDVITGVTFNLESAQPGTVETLSVDSDIDAIKENLESFVSNYNTLIGVMKGLSNYDQSTQVAGPLNGDSVLRGIQSSVRQALSNRVTGGVFANLTDIGISLGDGGSLVTDDAKLDEKLNGQLFEVNAFFSSESGFAQSFTTGLSGYVEDDGIIDSRSDGLQGRLDRIDDQRDVLTRRMAALEARLSAQFTAMDILVSQLQSTGSFLTQQLANLPTISSR
jgi:flagellar hook-associated protein 2